MLTLDSFSPEGYVCEKKSFILFKTLYYFEILLGQLNL